MPANDLHIDELSQGIIKMVLERQVLPHRLQDQAGIAHPSTTNSSVTKEPEPEILPLPQTPMPLPDNFPIWPVVGGDGAGLIISDTFGFGDHPIISGAVRNHGGIDIAVPIGTEIVAVLNGTVLEVGSDRIYGNFIELSHEDGVSTKYGHLNVLPRLNTGQGVSRGTIIGISGNTGMSTGPHLHFEYKMNGEKRDPFDGLFTQGILQLRRE